MIAAASQEDGLIGWLNRNSGAIQAVTTVCLAVVTAWYALLTRQMVQATRTSQRPYVYLDVGSTSGGGILELAINNYGERAAENVKFEILRDLHDRRGNPISSGTPLAKGISYLPPGRGYRFTAFVDAAIYGGKVGEHVLDVKVTYASSGRTYEDQLTIDFSEFEGVLLSSFRNSGEETARELHSISSSLREMKPARVFVPRLKACPFCSEMIKLAAEKCPKCLEWLPKSDAAEGEMADGVVSPEVEASGDVVEVDGAAGEDGVVSPEVEASGDVVEVDDEAP